MTSPSRARTSLRVCFLLLFMLTARVFAAETPEQVVTSYFEKLKSGGIGTVASLMHPDELRKFREMLAPVVEASFTQDKEETFRMFADPKNPTQMRKMDDAQFMNVFMEWVGKVQPGLTAALQDSKVEALGHVRENDVEHVVVRIKMKSGDIEIEKLSVISVKDDKGVPRMTLTGEMKGMAEALKRWR